MKKIISLLLFFVLLSISVLSQPSNNPIFPTKLEFVELVERVTSIEKQTPTIDVAGTDYYFGENGKIFLQLSEDGLPIDNASCDLSVYYPNNTLFVNSQSMISSDNGLQFYPFIVPSVAGVYMITANCKYFISEQWFFDLIGDIHYPLLYQNLNGSILGSTYNLNSYADSEYITTDAVKIGTTYYTGNIYDFQHETITNMSDAVLFWIGESNSVPTLTFYYFNWTNNEFVELPNSITLSQTINPQATQPSGISEFVTNPLPDDAMNSSGVIRIKIVGDGGTKDFIVYHNWLNIRFSELSNQSINFLRGGGELNVKNPISDMINLSGIFSRFDFIDALILSSYTNITSQVSTHDSDIKNLISNLDSDISSLSSQCNANYNLLDGRLDVVEDKIDLILEKLNVVTSDINLYAETFDCLEGTNWKIEITATDNFANYLTDEDIICDITTNLWGNESMIWNVDSFDYQHICLYANQTIDWGVECEEI